MVCVNCGEEIDLQIPIGGYVVECECGQLYNQCGQALNSMEEWDE
jgi:hypothetical protein